jgi:hypothetical protein
LGLFDGGDAVDMGAFLIRHDGSSVMKRLIDRDCHGSAKKASSVIVDALVQDITLLQRA